MAMVVLDARFGGRKVKVVKNGVSAPWGKTKLEDFDHQPDQRCSFIHVVACDGDTSNI